MAGNLYTWQKGYFTQEIWGVNSSPRLYLVCKGPPLRQKNNHEFRTGESILNEMPAWWCSREDLKTEKQKKPSTFIWNEKLSSFQSMFEYFKKQKLFWVMLLGEPLLWMSQWPSHCFGGDAFVDLGGFKFPISALKQHTTASKTRWPKRTDVYQMNQRDLLFIPKRWDVTYITFPQTVIFCHPQKTCHGWIFTSYRCLDWVCQGLSDWVIFISSFQEMNRNKKPNKSHMSCLLLIIFKLRLLTSVFFFFFNPTFLQMLKSRREIFNLFSVLVRTGDLAQHYLIIHNS